MSMNDGIIVDDEGGGIDKMVIDYWNRVVVMVVVVRRTLNTERHTNDDSRT